MSRRPTPALVVALLALFVSLGGTGYAALKISGKNVKDSSLTGKDIKNNSIAGADVKDRSLTAGDLGALEGPRGPQGPRGKAGPSGASLPPLAPPTPVLPFRPNIGECDSGRFCNDIESGGSGTDGWTNYGEGYAPAAFAKDRSGTVRLQGSVEGLHDYGKILRLPPGFRPSRTLFFPAYLGDAAAQPVEGAYISIEPDGLVNNNQFGGVSYLSLDGIRFRP